MRVELARLQVEQRADNPAVALAQHGHMLLRRGHRQPPDMRRPFAVIRLQPVERILLSRQRHEQRGVRLRARRFEQRDAGGGQRADEPGIHVEMRKGGAAARGMHPRRVFRLAHHSFPMPRQPRGCRQTGNPGPDHEVIDLFHRNCVAPCNHSA